MGEYRVDFDFVAIPVELFQGGLDSSAIAAYAGIRSLSRYQHEGVKLTDKEAGDASGMSDRAFRDARARLRNAGWIEWQRTGRENVYTIKSFPSVGHVIAEVRSEENANQTGTNEGQERQNSPSTTSGEKGDTPQEKPPAPPAPAADTWLTRYLETYRTLVGEPNAGRIAKALKPVHDEAGAEKTHELWDRWCRSKKTSFGPEWFAANWRKAANGAALTTTYDSRNNDREMERLK